MVTLFRVLLAVAAAATVCIGGWAAFMSLGVQEAPRAHGPVAVVLPTPEFAPPKPPLPPARAVAEASAERTQARPHEEVAFVVDGALPDRPLTLRVRSSWSRATVASQELSPGAAPKTIALPHGEHEVTVESEAGPASWLARARFTVPAPGPVPVSLLVGSLTVHVRDAAGTPVPRALVQLARSDDRAWVAPVPQRDGFAAPLTDADGNVTFAPLGAGEYRVALFDGDGPPVAVTLPDRGAVTLTATPRR